VHKNINQQTFDLNLKAEKPMNYNWRLEMPNRELMPKYEGNTYVGYLDISGFKQMMSDNRKKAECVLDGFYGTIYDNVYRANFGDSTRVKFNAVVVSDCAVLFLSRQDSAGRNDVDKIEGLSIILEIIKNMNRTFINHHYPFITTCSIAYGQLHYENRKEIDYIRKNCIRGQAYIDAFSDSESNEPRMQPGECRILKKSLKIALPDNRLFSLLKSKGKHYYFYWMLQDERNINNYELSYKGTKENMYDSLVRLMQDSCRPTNQPDRLNQKLKARKKIHRTRLA
jgi:hypothetical protein